MRTVISRRRLQPVSHDVVEIAPKHQVYFSVARRSQSFFREDQKLIVEVIARSKILERITGLDGLQERPGTRSPGHRRAPWKFRDKPRVVCIGVSILGLVLDHDLNAAIAHRAVWIARTWTPAPCARSACQNAVIGGANRRDWVSVLVEPLIS